MANNLHISYDLNSPGQDYEPLIAKIKTLGGWAKIHKSFWYVNSSLTPSQAVDALWPLMDKNDTLYVVDATNNVAAWQNLSDEVSSFIRDKWMK
ncbi:hypothetical protein LXM94_01330 [Rhizobium sp. TRM95111]|uniref:hypothetical protein n=1 Tax=Rhizobium alarense TaxID=2846851 RepID=UPI001F2D117E|nr:hypothetical protein [Rhizobium alarense]MCF3638611.1 hypothetical protein [Rhizobium alarense]